MSEEECELDSFALLVLGREIIKTPLPSVAPKVILFAVLQFCFSDTPGNF